MRKIILFFLLLSVVPLASQEQAAPKAKNTINKIAPVSEAPKELQDRIVRFFNKIVKDEISAGYDEFLAESPIFQRADEVVNLKKQTRKSIEVYGKLNGFEPVSAEFVTQSYIRLRYLGLHNTYPVRWIFTFYRSPEKGWIVTNLKFDDSSEFFFSDD